MAVKETLVQPLPQSITNESKLFRHIIPIGHEKTCDHPVGHLNCMTAKEWLKSQMGVWEFFYSGDDIRDKELHPATFPISLSNKVIELFTHEGELIVDPFVGSGTTLVAAQDLNRNAVGFDLQEQYVSVCEQRLVRNNLFNQAQQIAVQGDALQIANYIAPETISLIWTSPPY